MKETKKFFDNNRLNKGSSKVPNVRQSDASIFAKKYQHILPPLDMMEQYEELNPGTCAKLIAMAEKEQNHRHSADMLAIEQYKRAICLGRRCALFLVVLIAASAVSIMLFGSVLLASIFVISSFISIMFFSYLFSKNSSPRETSYNKYNNKPRNYRNNRSFNKKPK